MRCVAWRYVSFNLSRRFKEDIATLVEHCNRTFVNASVFLVSCGGLLVKKKQHQFPSSIYFAFYCVKKNLADLVPACWVVSALLCSSLIFQL